MLIVKSAGCGVLGDWAKQRGYWHSYTETPKPGDLALFDFSGKHASRNHIGIVASVSGSAITTIEGNTGTGNDANGGAVMERKRSVAHIVGYIRPPYTSTQTAEKAVAIARAEIGVTEWPADSNKVKYNTWFYGSAVSGAAYPWCAAFVCWVFAVLAGEISAGATSNTAAAGGMSAYIRQFQSWLNTNYSAGLSADGSFGKLTRTAVGKALQKYLNERYSAGLAVDGAIGALTRNAMSAHRVAAKKGDNGDLVYILQGMLYCRGCDPKGFDGSFGGGTDAAVRTFQKTNALLVDGEAGSDTFAALFSA